MDSYAIQLSSRIICGDDARIIIEKLQIDPKCFTQRKNYDEYYFTCGIYHLTPERIILLSNHLEVSVHLGNLRITVS